jgi:hypothetical protein
MSAALYREFVISTPSVASILWRFLKLNASVFASKGTPLRVIVTEEEMDRLDEQIAYYFGVTVKTIAEQVWINGRQFDKDAWHEELAKKFLPTRELLLPDGEIILKRSSIARGKISLKKMTAYIQEVEAYAASELGVEFAA